MQMTVSEIKRSYDQAKDKKKQIGILADLNCCSREEIEKILAVESNRKTSDAVNTVTEEHGMGEVKKMLFAKLEELENQIESLEEEYRKVTIAIEVLEKVSV